MSTAITFSKQVSIFMPPEDWILLRKEAARQHMPMTDLMRRWIEPELAKLRQNQPTNDNE